MVMLAVNRGSVSGVNFNVQGYNPAELRSYFTSVIMSKTMHEELAISYNGATIYDDLRRLTNEECPHCNVQASKTGATETEVSTTPKGKSPAKAGRSSKVEYELEKNPETDNI